MARAVRLKASLPMRAERFSVRSRAPSARFLLRALPLLVALAGVFAPRSAHAYTWMVRHGYSGCAPCHQDPSGGGILTAYGRAVSGEVLYSRYGKATPGEADPLSDFMLGAFPLPEWLMLGGDARLMTLKDKPQDVETRNYTFLMQADFEAALNIHHVLASASIGYAEDGAFGAAITDAPEKNLVSRVHWLGYEFNQDTGLVLRAGRMNLPFGIRNVEHTSWVRDKTRTSINDNQQHGISIAWSPEPFHGELMAILGNYQIKPDDYRERGYSGYLEWQPVSRLALGASSTITHVDVDQTYLKETWNQAHGLFARWATGWEPLVVLAEADYVFRSPKNDYRRKGITSYVQADVEPLQGVHFVLTGEAQNVGVSGTPMSWGLWVSEAWFLAPHLDLRIDNIYQSVADIDGRSNVLTLLAQAHLYL